MTESLIGFAAIFVLALLRIPLAFAMGATFGGVSGAMLGTVTMKAASWSRMPV